MLCAVASPVVPAIMNKERNAIAILSFILSLRRFDLSRPFHFPGVFLVSYSNGNVISTWSLHNHSHLTKVVPPRTVQKRTAEYSRAVRGRDKSPRVFRYVFIALVSLMLARKSSKHRGSVISLPADLSASPLLALHRNIEGRRQTLYPSESQLPALSENTCPTLCASCFFAWERLGNELQLLDCPLSRTESAGRELEDVLITRRSAVQIGPPQPIFGIEGRTLHVWPSLFRLGPAVAQPELLGALFLTYGDSVSAEEIQALHIGTTQRHALWSAIAYLFAESENG